MERPAWMSYISVTSALLIALVMLVAGIWKTTDPLAAATRLHQALVPASLSLPGAILLGIGETFAGVLLLVPRFRRWGAWLSVLLLIAFLGYIGYFYDRLHGAECNCFPWIERAVGPAFFIGDTIMLILAVLAGLWAPPARSLRSAALVLAAVAVFAGVSYGVAVTQQSGGEIQESIVVAGEPFPLDSGRVLLYFFDPECSSCFFAARDLSGYTWNDVKIVAIPTVNPQWGQQFLGDSGLEAPLSSDIDKLRGMFSFGDPPFAVAIDNGRQAATIGIFEEPGLHSQLAEIGFVE